mmetsp:Transcript_7490/g.19468  ORF Transcript_7490/g.19468 Transcript_7490/m.19468 type:complete len:247 (+) Transcript_7490:581-1321(+)
MPCTSAPTDSSTCRARGYLGDRMAKTSSRKVLGKCSTPRSGLVPRVAVGYAQEDTLETRLRDRVCFDAHCLARRLQRKEELGECRGLPLCSGGHAQRHCRAACLLHRAASQRASRRGPVSHEFECRVECRAVVAQPQHGGVPVSESALEAVRCSEALEAAADHDAHPLAERLGLLHRMRGDDSARARLANVRANCRPHATLGRSIHARAWFVEKNQRWRANQCNCEAEFALVAARVSRGRPVCVSL